MSVRGDEIEIAANTGLRGMDIAQIVRTVDDPEFAIARGEIENLFVLRENDQSREAQFRMNGNDVFPAVLDDPRSIAGSNAERRCEPCCAGKYNCEAAGSL